jgi:hypothetical protein
MAARAFGAPVEFRLPVDSRFCRQGPIGRSGPMGFRLAHCVFQQSRAWRTAGDARCCFRAAPASMAAALAAAAGGYSDHPFYTGAERFPDSGRPACGCKRTVVRSPFSEACNRRPQTEFQSGRQSKAGPPWQAGTCVETRQGAQRASDPSAPRQVEGSSPGAEEKPVTVQLVTIFEMHSSTMMARNSRSM